MTNINKLATNLSIVNEELNKLTLGRAIHTIADRLEDAVWEVEHDHHQPKLAEQLESKVSQLTAAYYTILTTARQMEYILTDITKQIERNTNLYNLLVLSYKSYDTGYAEEAEMHSLDFAKSCNEQLAESIIEEFCNDFDFDGDTTSIEWLTFHRSIIKGIHKGE